MRLSGHLLKQDSNSSEISRRRSSVSPHILDKMMRGTKNTRTLKDMKIREAALPVHLDESKFVQKHIDYTDGLTSEYFDE